MPATPTACSSPRPDGGRDTGAGTAILRSMPDDPLFAPAPEVLASPAARTSYRDAAPVVGRLRAAGHEAYLVGGGIRDLLLGREVADWDVATSAEPEAVLALWPDALPTGIRHGTVTVRTGGDPVEVTTYRAEGPYSDGRRPDWVRFGVSLREDLSRRDFTVNALAYDPDRRRLADPAGGVADLGHRLIRTVGDPDARFDEDGLRPLRGIRLAAVLEFAIDPATLAAMARARDRAEGVARERIRDEFLKLLRARRPSVGIDLLRRTGLLELVAPELLEGVGMAQNRFHAYDVYEHTLRAVDAAPAGNPRVRVAALLHDVGKPRTRVVVEGEGTFHHHEQVGAALTRDILDRLRFPRAERDAVALLVKEHMFHYTPEWSDAAVRRFLRRVGPENVDDLFMLREADTEAHGTGESAREPLAELGGRIRSVRSRADALTVGDLAVNGGDLMQELGLAPGPEVGRILNALVERVLEQPSLNRRGVLLREARKLHRTS